MKRTTPIITLLLIFALTFSSAAHAADRKIVRRQGTAAGADLKARTALVIGNGDYRASPLQNPVNDARAMARTLEALGFAVDKRENIGWREMSAAATVFGDRLMKGGVGLFYYAGHGIQYRGKNYLIPVDSDIRHEKEIPYKAVDVGLVLAQMENARNRLNIVVLDACRDNPFARSFRSAQAGLAYTDAPVGTLIAYATSPGKTAADGSGGNGLYTAELIRNMQTPGMGVLEMFMKVRKNVRQKSDGRQIPWESTSLEGNFYFNPERDGGGDGDGPLVADSGGAVVETPAPRPETKEASLTIASDVSGSTVWINGQKMGGGPPLSYPNIRPGHYRVKVGKEGYEPYERRVEVEPGKAYEVTAHLEKIGEAPAPVAPIPSPAPAARDRFTNSLGMEFVRIPAGSFTMGSPEDEPGRDSDEKQHRVTLSDDYFMQTTEVTVGQWRSFVNATGYRTEAEKGDGAYVISGGSWKKEADADWENPYFSQNDRHPVTCISWNDAKEFIKWLNRKEDKTYRLPTEAEWEYAARAETTTPFTYGRCLSTDQANYDGNYPLDGCAKGEYRKKTIPVGSLNAPNGYGLHDMHGNVWEWCQDWYGDYPDNASVDPGGPSDASYRVIRGGSWYGNARGCRAAYRDYYFPSYRYYYIGFRLALSPGR